ncbi:hypothetical protein BDR26DRAFT_443180 [Obelidium mucronatum]|nr:hypothetical protein BDR26DRAFT_443180 [Obelidium mucronatum]
MSATISNQSAEANAIATHEDVVHPHEDHTEGFNRVIAIAVDASPCSEYAFDWMIKNIIRPETDQIVIINVRPVVSLPVVYGPAYIDFTKETESLEAANKKESHDLLRAYANKLPARKYNMRGVALRGDPRDEIAAKVNEMKVDMLVIGNRGLSGFKRALLGSVSEYLIHHLTVPVIISHAPEVKTV